MQTDPLLCLFIFLCAMHSSNAHKVKTQRGKIRWVTYKMCHKLKTKKMNSSWQKMANKSQIDRVFFSLLVNFKPFLRIERNDDCGTITKTKIQTENKCVMRSQNEKWGSGPFWKGTSNTSEVWHLVMHLNPFVLCYWTWLNQCTQIDERRRWAFYNLFVSFVLMSIYFPIVFCFAGCAIAKSL